MQTCASTRSPCCCYGLQHPRRCICVMETFIFGFSSPHRSFTRLRCSQWTNDACGNSFPLFGANWCNLTGAGASGRRVDKTRPQKKERLIASLFPGRDSQKQRMNSGQMLHHPRSKTAEFNQVAVFIQMKPPHPPFLFPSVLLVERMRQFLPLPFRLFEVRSIPTGRLSPMRSAGQRRG